MSVSWMKADFVHLEAAGLHIGAAVAILHFDPPSVDDLDPPRVLHLPAVGCPSVPGNGKLLCGGVAVLIGFPKDLADTPLIFLKACGKAGEEKLHLLRA